ncbi:MAG: hypothetical protein PF450_08895, partial [Bacteroidales bacterium]|nr:hypothetical protein [Bacteroidales bacterium]
MSGSKAGPWGAAAGAVAGLASGVFKMVQSNKLRKRENTDLSEKYSDQDIAYNDALEGELSKRAASMNGEYFQNFYAKKGGVFPGSDDLAIDMFMEKLTKTKIEAAKTEIQDDTYRHGGAMNVIPKGVTHEQVNSLGDKGIPVVTMVDGKYKKVAEVELNEIIFEKGVTTEIEERTKRYK